jgi:DNA polymerase-1
MKTTLLIDADAILYQHAYRNQSTFNFGDGEPCVHTDSERAKIEMIEELDKWMSRLGADDLIICLSDPARRYFRHDVLPTYKAGRSESRPVLLDDLADVLKGQYETFVRPKLEADDVMGILSTHPRLVKGEKIIVSPDKDMLTIPGRLYNPRTDEETAVTEDEADRWHIYQTLVGDSCDGYAGCPRIGPKKAAKAMEDCPTADLWETVVSLFEAKGLTEDDALIQARVARICRAVDYDFRKKAVKLWTPYL